MTVLHISGATSWGGNEQQLIDIIPALKKLNVKSLVFGVKNSPLHNKCEENSIQFIYSETEKLNKFSNYKFLKQLVKDINPSIIHLHTSNSITVFVISDLLYKLKTPTVFSKKGMGNSMSWLSLYKYNYKNINAVLCVSEAVRKSMKAKIMKLKNHHKLKVVYEGINIDRLQLSSLETTNTFSIDNNKNKFTIGNIANHNPAKDLVTLIKAIDYLVNEIGFKKFHLYQIGAYSKHTAGLKELIEELNIKNYISLVGFVKGVEQVFSKFDIYVMSSEREGLPLTIYEAFYKKIPVVSTKAGGIPEVISDGVNGFLVKIKDYKKLAKKIKELLESKETQAKFSEASFKLFNKKYDVNKTAIKMLDEYHNIAK